MSPITQTFTKDNSPVCRRTHHKGTQKKGSLFPPLGFPLPSIQDICGTVSCHWIWRTCGYLLFATTRRRKVFSLYFYYPGHGRSLTAEKCPCHPLRSYLHRGTEQCPGTMLWVWQTLSLTGGLDSCLQCLRISKTSSRRDILVFLLPSQPCCKQ